MKTETRAKPTPGPWRVNQRTEKNGYGTITFQEIVVDRGYGPYVQCLNLIEGDGKDHSERNARAVADARLIAAAPRMYNFILDAARNGNQDARQIIAAVEGEQ